MYEYRAVVIDVHDGDTLRARVDLGFGIHADMTFRLARINTPEVIGATRDAGLRSRDRLRELVLGAPVVLVQTLKDRREKYGRYLAEVFIDPPPTPGAQGWTNVNDRLVREGLAVYVTY